MTLEEESRLSFYREVATLNESHGVFLVQHTESKRVYVKKTLRVFNANVYRYLKDHPVLFTPHVYEVIEDEENLIVIEEYISGDSLKELMDAEEILPEKKVVDIITGICDALAGLHGVKPPIIHRDVKPTNIIITPNGGVVLLDMNAAKVLSEGKQEDTQLIGTHGYAAPEQYGFGASDVQADIYATGVLLNEMLTGEKPSVKHATGKFGDIITRCTMMDAKDRYSSVQELSAAVNGVPFELHQKTNNFRRFLPPGFRSDDLFFKLLGGAGYVLLIVVTLSLNLEHATTVQQWMNRISFFIPAMSVVLFTGNYLNVWEFTHVNRIRNKLLKAVVVAVADVFVFVILLIIIAGIERVLSGGSGI